MVLARLDRLVTPERIRAYALILIVVFVVAGIGWIATMKNLVDGLEKPLGYDFITFYAASDLALQGRPTDAYDAYKIYASEVAAVPANTSIFLWHYPPTFQLLIAPLATMPYPLALAVFCFSTLCLYLLLARQISDHRWAMLLAFAFPATFVNLMHGQNAFLNTALLGFGLLWLDRRPWLAGVMIGLLVYKPHFGVLLPFLLMVQGRWKTFASATVTALAFCAAAYLAFGLETWQAFVDNFGLVREILENRFLPWGKIPSVFVGVASLGLPLPVAYAVHGAIALGLAVATLWAWRKPGDQRLKVALAVPAILSVSPYLFDYDLVLLAIPIGLLADHARRHALPRGGKIGLVFAFFLPVAFAGFAKVTGVQPMWIGVMLLYAIAWTVLARDRRGDVVEDAAPVPAVSGA